MPNNFSTIKNEQASEKFYLIRLVPRRYINDSLFLVGGGIYNGFFSYPIQKVKANDIELTKVTTVINPNEYSYDEASQTITVYSTPSASNSIIVYYYIFFTGGRHRVVNEDPENNSTPLRDWEPRIVTNPTIGQSIENVVNGFLSVSTSQVSLINDRYEFQSYLTANDSFDKAEIKIWLCLNNIENIQKVFDSKISKVSLNNNKINILLDDPLAKLLEQCYMGDDKSEVYFTKDDFPNLNPNSNGALIRYFIGTASRYKTISETVSGLANAQRLDPETLTNAVCTNYSNSISTTTNREWGIGRVSSNGFLDFSFTTSNIDNSSPNFTRLDGTAAQVDKFRIGDTFVITNGGTPYYVRVLYVDRTNNYIYTTKEASIASGDAVSANNCPSIVIYDGVNTYYPLYQRDYTATVSNTSSGNKYLKITFVNNFEASIAGLTTLDPGLHQVKFKIRPDTTDAKHGSVAKSILENAGLTVNTASVTAANTSLAVNCNFSIPNFDETDYKNYLEYLQDILKSSLSYVTLNNSFEIEYKLFSSPSSINEITDVDILLDSFNIEIQYKDIVTQIISFNPHWSSSEATEDVNDTPSYTASSNKAKYLHETDRVTRFRHVLESMNVRLEEILKVRTERYALYNFNTKIINVDNIIGDDIKLVRNGLLGNEASSQVKIVSISKSPEKTNILATDLLNL